MEGEGQNNNAHYRCMTAGRRHIHPEMDRGWEARRNLLALLQTSVGRPWECTPKGVPGGQVRPEREPP